MKRMMFLILFFSLICFSVSAMDFSLGAGIYYHNFEISENIFGVMEVLLNFRGMFITDLFFNINETISIGPGIQFGYTTLNINDAESSRVDIVLRLQMETAFGVFSVIPYFGMSGIYNSNSGYSGASSFLDLYFEGGSKFVLSGFFADVSYLFGLNGIPHFKFGLGYQYNF